LGHRIVSMWLFAELKDLHPFYSGLLRGPVG
jgi:hypothetical protein